MDKPKIAACGIDCSECDVYKAQHDIKVAESLVEWFKGQGWIEADEDVNAILKMMPLCKGCWESDVPWCGDCEVRECCTNKELDNCSRCNDFSCEMYKKWVNNLDHHVKAMEYLHSIRTSS